LIIAKIGMLLMIMSYKCKILWCSYLNISIISKVLKMLLDSVSERPIFKIFPGVCPQTPSSPQFGMLHTLMLHSSNNFSWDCYSLMYIVYCNPPYIIMSFSISPPSSRKLLICPCYYTVYGLPLSFLIK